jgi:hypothetical protein
MDDPAEQLKIRDSLRKKLVQQATPEERLRDMMRLQQMTWDLLRQSPEGYAHFMRRNFKARAIPVPDAHAP